MSTEPPFSDGALRPRRRGRRQFLSYASAGLAVAVTDRCLGDTAASAERVAGQASVPWPHHPPRAKRVIHIVACGGVSQVDSFDYKPALEALHGKSLVTDERPDVFFGKVGLLRKSDWDFRQHGESGLWISDLFPNLGSVADDKSVFPDPE